MADVEGFFDNLGGGAGAPGAKLKDMDDFVIGEIVDQFMAPATDFATKKPKVDERSGKEIEQLVVIVQTDHRNWENVNKVPLKDKDDASKGPKDPSEDDGRRAVYVEPYTNIAYAVRDAIRAAGVQQGGLKTGGKLGVKIVGFKDTGKGNPAKQHGVKYEPPAAAAASDGFFGGGDSAPAQSAPAEQQQQQQSAPAAEQPSAPQDPWATPGSAPAKDKPPF